MRPRPQNLASKPYWPRGLNIPGAACRLNNGIAVCLVARPTTDVFHLIAKGRSIGLSIVSSYGRLNGSQGRSLKSSGRAAGSWSSSGLRRRVIVVKTRSVGDYHADNLHHCN